MPSSTPNSPPSSHPGSLPSSPPPGVRRLSNRPSPLNPASPASTPAALPVSPLAVSSSLAMLPAGAPIIAPGMERQKSRARDLLRKHYGMGVGPPAPLHGRTPDPMDLDSSAFDAKGYYEQLITTASLPALLKRENDLLAEIRQLDSERQSLVYNHHHELIAASDTIAAMKTRAEGLDADLDALMAAFSEISRLSAEVAIEHPIVQSERTSES